MRAVDSSVHIQWTDDRHHHVRVPLWRTKKSHFRPSGEVSMKKVDQDVVNTKYAFFLLSRCIKFLEMYICTEFSCT